MKPSIVLLAAAAACLVAGSAGAQPQAGGFTFGVSVGGAYLTCGESCDGSGGLGSGLRIGYMFTPKLAVLVGTSGAETVSGDPDISHAHNGVAVKFWAVPRLWFQGGAGIGRLTKSRSDFSNLEYDIEYQSDWSFTFMAGAGYEFVQLGKVAFDVQARYVWVDTDKGSVSNVAVLLGFDFYAKRRKP
jgi:hypothetical protein